MTRPASIAERVETELPEIVQPLRISMDTLDGWSARIEFEDALDAISDRVLFEDDETETYVKTKTGQMVPVKFSELIGRTLETIMAVAVERKMSPDEIKSFASRVVGLIAKGQA